VCLQRAVAAEVNSYSEQMAELDGRARPRASAELRDDEDLLQQVGSADDRG
jgi:hypothetical protein